MKFFGSGGSRLQPVRMIAPSAHARNVLIIVTTRILHLFPEDSNAHWPSPIPLSRDPLPSSVTSLQRAPGAARGMRIPAQETTP